METVGERRGGGWRLSEWRRSGKHALLCKQKEAKFFEEIRKQEKIVDRGGEEDDDEECVWEEESGKRKIASARHRTAQRDEAEEIKEGLNQSDRGWLACVWVGGLERRWKESRGRKRNGEL